MNIKDPVVKHTAIIEKNRDAEKDKYTFDTTKRNNPKSFKDAYEILLTQFKDSNPDAYWEVQKTTPN